MPLGPADRLARWLRLTAVGILAVTGIVRIPDPGRDAIATMVQQAEDLAYVEAFLPARTKLETALGAAKRLRDPELIALCLDRIGSVLDFEGRTAAGMERHERALVLAREIEDRRLGASILASMGLAHWRQSEYTLALGALHQALAIQDELGDDTGRARTLVFIGRVHFKKAEYTEANESYRRAVAILKSAEDRRWLSIALEDLGDLALEQGFFVEALDAYQRALEWRREMGDRAGEVYMLTVVGRGYLGQGAHREALVWFERALALSRRIGDRAGQALAFYHVGIAHDKLADPAQALALYARALVLKEELGDRRQQGWILRHMGDAHAVQGDLPSALDAHSRAIRIWEEIQDPRGVSTGLLRMGAISVELGQYAEAVESFRRATEILGTSHPAYVADALAGMGRAYAAAGNELRALEHGRRAAEIARRGPDVVRWSTMRSLGWIERRLERREDALVSYRESLAIIEALRGRVVASSDVREGFLEDKQAVYGETVELLMELGRAEEALEVAERSCARAFVDLLSGRNVLAKPVNHAAPAGGPGPLSDSNPGERLQSELAALSAAAPEMAGLVTTPALTLAQSRKEVSRSGGTILQYFSAPDRLFIWVLTPDGAIRARSSRISRRELSELVGAARGSIGVETPSRGDAVRRPVLPASRDASPDPRPLLRRLHGVLIEPVSDLLPGDRDRLITIVPHGPLFLIPFAALVDANGSYFVERHTLAYSPSISVLRYTGLNRDRVVDSAPRLLVVGNPAMPEPKGSWQPLPALPGAEREATAIGGLYPSRQVTTLIGSRARERTVRELALGQTIIHLATHAVIFDNDPMGSYLALAPETVSRSKVDDPLSDGLLTVSEVFGLHLRADLVTLSACNTGLGRVSGEGVVGLARAFIYAGTASVLVSLWRVADTVATTEMEGFYRGLIRTGGNKAAALAGAQREMIVLLRQGKIQSPSGRVLDENPLLWAAFVLVGEAR
jgi:CHAT domain-containing protein/tetratricopeptide (TPR) repeat protein